MPENRKSVLITGATGLLGRQAVRAFEQDGWKVVGIGYSRAKPPSIKKVNLCKEEEVLGILDETKPDVIIHSAAEKFPDRCNSDPVGTRKLNVESTSFLAKESAKRNITLIYISTDYVFDGEPGAAPYEADSQTNPPNFYGQTKLSGENATLGAYPDGGAVVLRLPVLYGEVEQSSESSVNTLLDKVWNVDKKQKVDMDHWSIRYPTNTSDAARVLKDIARKYSDPSVDKKSLPRILQFTSEDKMTKYEMCQVLADIAGLPSDHIVPNSTNDPTATVVRPYDTHLSTKKLKELEISVETVPFRTWWQRYLKAYKK